MWRGGGWVTPATPSVCRTAGASTARNGRRGCKARPGGCRRCSSAASRAGREPGACPLIHLVRRAWARAGAGGCRPRPSCTLVLSPEGKGPHVAGSPVVSPARPRSIAPQATVRERKAANGGGGGVSTRTSAVSADVRPTGTQKYRCPIQATVRAPDRERCGPLPRPRPQRPTETKGRPQPGRPCAAPRFSADGCETTPLPHPARTRIVAAENASCLVRVG